MDNHFVPNLTWGHQFTNAIASKSKHPIMWVHLMVTDPGSFLGRFNIRPDSIVSFHLEVNIDVLQMINEIKLKGWRPGIAVKPKTAIEDVFPFLDVVDHVLVMSVEPGFSGQDFIKDSVEKIKALDTYRKETGRKVTIGIDGGITQDNIEQLVQLGVQDFAAASAIFNKYSKPVEALQALNKRIKK